MEKRKPGRPRKYPDKMTPVMVHLDKGTIKALEAIDENRSKAVREAVKIASETRAE